DHGKVEAGEAHRVKRREGGEDGPAPQDQPDLVAFPGRSDDVEQHPSFGIGPRREGQQRPHPQVAPAHDGEADQQYAQQQPPDQPQGFIVERNGAHDPSSLLAGVAGRPAMTKSSSSSAANSLSLGPARTMRIISMTMMTKSTV